MNNQIIAHLNNLNTLLQQAEEAKEKTSKILKSTYSDLCELEAEARDINEQINIVRTVYEAALQAEFDAQQFKIKIANLIQEQDKI
jgi:uncharacterized protein involved in exopolysaccharide biosynthesis